MAEKPNAWPRYSYAEWADTKKTLQLYTQIAGKLRVQLSPDRPVWLHTGLKLTTRGITTGPMPWGTEAVEMQFDLIDHKIIVLSTTGVREEIGLVPARYVGEVWRLANEALVTVGVEPDLWPKPQELEDVTPLDQDTKHKTYDPEAVTNWFKVLTATRNVFDEFAARFFGKAELNLWWGAFDYTLLLFNGKHAAPHPGANYIMRTDLVAEMANFGFYSGDETTDGYFYGYIYPEPPGCPAAIMPAEASWTEGGFWRMDYDALLASDDPGKLLAEFLGKIYEFAGSAGGWDLESFEYPHPEITTREW